MGRVGHCLSLLLCLFWRNSVRARPGMHDSLLQAPEAVLAKPAYHAFDPFWHSSKAVRQHCRSWLTPRAPPGYAGAIRVSGPRTALYGQRAARGDDGRQATLRAGTYGWNGQRADEWADGLAGQNRSDHLASLPATMDWQDVLPTLNGRASSRIHLTPYVVPIMAISTNPYCLLLHRGRPSTHMSLLGATWDTER